MKEISGNYGFEEGSLLDHFLITLEEVKPESPVAPVKPEVKPVTPVAPVKPEVKPVTPKTPVAHEEKKHTFTYTENVA